MQLSYIFSCVLQENKYLCVQISIAFERSKWMLLDKEHSPTGKI